MLSEVKEGEEVKEVKKKNPPREAPQWQRPKILTYNLLPTT